MKPPKLTYPFLLGISLLALFSLVVGPTAAQSAGKGRDGSSSQSDVNSKPHLEVNGKRIEPIADFKSDFVLSVPRGRQIWTLLKEFSPHKDINLFGIYSDIGVGQRRTVLFFGPDNSPLTRKVRTRSSAEIGLWLLHDVEEDSVFSADEVLLFSERFLTVGAEKPERQYFMVFDVSEFKGTGAEYKFETKSSEEFETSGDFDFLIFADDSRPGKRFDHNDMIIGLLFGDSGNGGGGNPPVVTCPADMSITVCELSRVCIPGFEYFDPDGDIASVELIGGEFDGDLVCFVPHEGINTLMLKVTDRTGQSDSCSVDIDVTLNHSPVIEDQFFSDSFGGRFRRIVLIAFDQDNDTLQYRLLEGVGSIRSFFETGEIRYVPDTSGVYSFIVEVSDSCASDTALIQDTVRVISLSYVTNSLLPLQVPAGGLSQFSFDLELLDSVVLTAIPIKTSLVIRANDFFASLKLELPDNQLTIGITKIRSEPLFIPDRLQGDSLSLFMRLVYYEADSTDIGILGSSFNNQRIPVVQMPVVRIIDVVNSAPNNPMVNTGQSFNIECRVANLTALATPSIDLRMVTDGNSQFDSLLSVLSIAPFDTITVSYDVVAAGESNTLELFHVNVVSQVVGEAPSSSNFAPAVVQTPASLRLIKTLLGVRSGTVESGEQFELIVRLQNDGESEATAGRFSLSTNGVDLGIDDPITGEIAIDSNLTFHFTAPLVDMSDILLSFIMTELPLDINSVSPAPLQPDRFEIPLRVVSQTGDLIATAKGIGPNFVASGQVQELFELTLTNIENVSATAISVEEIRLRVRPGTSGPADLARFLELNQTGFVDQGILLSAISVDGEILRLTFSGLTIEPSALKKIQFQLAMRERVREDFRVTLTTVDIVALFADGPFAGDSVRVISSSGGTILFDRHYATVGNNLQSSFEIENNPFNPLNGPANFAYFLEQPGDIEFRVFSLVGREIYALDITEGAAGTQANVRQMISWDGRDNAGSMVPSGVYVAMILLKSNGQKATMKVAVLK